MADIDKMMRTAKERVPAVFYANVLPWNNGDDDAAGRILQLNDKIAELASLHGVRLLDFYATLESPDEPRRMAPDWTVEGNHPSVEGHRRLGGLAWPAGALAEAEVSSLLDDDAAS